MLPRKAVSGNLRKGTLPAQYLLSATVPFRLQREAARDAAP
jgi:hypothetical protein